MFSTSLKSLKPLSLLWTVPLQCPEAAAVSCLALVCVVCSCRLCLVMIQCDVNPSALGISNNVVNLVNRLWAGWCRFRCPEGYISSSSQNISKSADSPLSPPLSVHWADHVISLGIKGPGNEVEQILPSNAAVNKCRCTAAPPLFTAWTSLPLLISAWVSTFCIEYIITTVIILHVTWSVMLYFIVQF